MAKEEKRRGQAAGACADVDESGSDEESEDSVDPEVD